MELFSFHIFENLSSGLVLALLLDRTEDSSYSSQSRSLSTVALQRGASAKDSVIEIGLSAAGGAAALLAGIPFTWAAIVTFGNSWWAKRTGLLPPPPFTNLIPLLPLL